MHVKLTTSGGRRYVQLVESYRDEAGRVKKRTVATLGRAEQVDGSLDAVINGLLKITGREPMGAKPPAPTGSFESARALGNVWALTELWKSLGFSDLRRVFRRTRRTTVARRSHKVFQLAQTDLHHFFESNVSVLSIFL